MHNKEGIKQLDLLVLGIFEVLQSAIARKDDEITANPANRA